jgi:YopX protein
MKKVLKFRVWCNTTKHFTDIPFYSCSGGQLLWHHTVNEITISNIDEGDYEVQQFTGLKDKNGKEIYEGDVITGYFDMGPAGMTINTAIVRWTNKEGYQWVYWDLNSIEVVGNIFDNLELLKL